MGFCPSLYDRTIGDKKSCWFVGNFNPNNEIMKTTKRQVKRPNLLSRSILTKAMTLIICILPATRSISQSTEWRHSLGSSVFLVGNLDRAEPPNYLQLNYGYQLTPKDNIVVEAITWTVYQPVGIPYFTEGPYYPGKIRSLGIGAGYQRFHWKKLYTTVQATPFRQYYYDESNEIISRGIQLWLQLRLGYRVEFLQGRLFLEPSVVCNYWPVNTNFPDAFSVVEQDWPNYFLFEPGLHFGIKF